MNSNSEAGQSSSYFDSVYDQTPPWDIGVPQPDLLALFDEDPPASPVLDVGCGTGTLAIALAQRGLTVLGVDLAGVAIAQARSKATALAPEVGRRLEFRVADALQPEQLPGPFGAVVDCGFYHVFGLPERERFVHNLSSALAAGGRYYLLGFAIAARYPNAPKQVREDELRALFSPEKGWRILALRPARFQVGPTRIEVPAIAACMERTA